MTKRILSLSIIAIFAILLFTSCSKKTNKQGRYIPSDAGFVVLVNGESLNAKLPWTEIKQNEAFQKMIADTSVSSFTKSLLENPENSGVNIKANFILFVVKDTTGGYTAVEGSINDEAKFKTMLASALKNGKETTKDGFTYFADEKTSVAYNKEKFVIAINTPELNDMQKAVSAAMDTTNQPAITEVKYTRDMNAVAAGILALKEDASLAKNEKFSGLMTEKGDAHLWFNAEYFSSSAALPGIGAMAKYGHL